MVLEVSRYLDEHPGGKFLLEHTIGRDVSKFFYGGYALDGNNTRKGSKRKNHSNVARSVVEQLAIAKLCNPPTF
jgi:cytochrome b involved in lipid metabolism